MNYQNSISAEQFKQSLQSQSLQNLQSGAVPASMTASVMEELAVQCERLQRLANQLESTFGPVIHEQSHAQEVGDHSPIAPMPPLLSQIRDMTQNLTNNLSRIQSVVDRSAL